MFFQSLNDDVFLERHKKGEVDEKRRKRWDIQRIRELRNNERLKMGKHSGAPLPSSPCGCGNVAEHDLVHIYLFIHSFLHSFRHSFISSIHSFNHFFREEETYRRQLCTEFGAPNGASSPLNPLHLKI